MNSESAAAKKMTSMEAVNSLSGDEMTASKATEQEKLAKTARENQQIILYIFVSAIIAVAYVLGSMEFSFIWVFLMIALTFVVWWGKVLHLTEEHVKYHEQLVHRKRALRHMETAEWLNFVVNRWWVFSSPSISDLMKKHLDPLLTDVRPAFIESIELHSFTVGENTPFIKYMKVYECSDSLKKPLSWLNISSPPPGLALSQNYQIVLEADVALHAEDFKMVFRTRLGGKWMGMNMDVAVEKLNICGKMQMIINFDMNTSFPHIQTLSLSFQEKPEVWFAIRMLKSLQMMEIPLLKSWIHSLVMDGLTQALVDPGKIDIAVETAGPTYAPAKSRSKSKAQGVLTVTISSEQSKASVFSDDVRYCSLRVGEQKQNTKQTQGPGSWQDTCSFLVHQLKSDRLQIKLKSKRLLSTYTLAQFDLNLSDFPFELKNKIEHSVEEKTSKWQSSGSAKLDLLLDYTALKPIDEENIDAEADKPIGHIQGVSGVLFVCVHGAQNLLALDRCGASDPYCIIFSNGKKIKTTHYVCKTRNPSWEVSTEIIVGDFTKTMLSFLVYDWDGHNASEDDFLGSAYIVLSPEEPHVIKKTLTLGYNLLNLGQVDNMKLGTITVSAIFRPVGSVTRSDIGGLETQMSFQEHQATKNKNFMTSAKEVVDEAFQFAKLKLTGTKDKGVGDLLSMGHGILELNIMRAKDLVPMDSNGFSDPFCEVRIGHERKFTTSVKKKTLNPIWDEWVTMQLPKPEDVLEIIAWDRDPFFKKDFLGSVSFTLDDLKKYSKEPINDGWFQLQRIRSGYVQLNFKVIQEELTPQDSEPHGLQVGESMDSGFPVSPNNSPLTEDDDTPTRGRRSRTTSSNAGTNMSPIHEASTEIPRIGTPPHSLSEEDVFDQDEIHGHHIAVTAPSSARPPRKKWTLKSLRIKRSASDTSMKANLKDKIVGKSASLKHNNNHLQVPGANGSGSPMLLRKSASHSSLENSFTDITTASSPYVGEDKYYNVTGRVIKARGLKSSFPHVYCKIRIDNRNIDQRMTKSSQGKVLCKARSLDHDDGDASFDLSFDVDKGKGIGREASLILDVKTGPKNHLATKGFVLQDIFEDATEVTKWLTVQDDIQFEVNLRRNTLTLPFPSESSSIRHRSKLKENET